MITVGLFYEVKRGKEGLFEGKFEEVLAALEGRRGHVGSLLYHQVKRANSYAIFSEWESEEHFRAFIQSDLFGEVTRWGLGEILEGRPRHKVYDRMRLLPSDWKGGPSQGVLR